MNYTYITALCLLAATAAHATPLERVALSPLVPPASPKKDENSKRFFEVRTSYNQRVSFVDPATGTQYYKNMPVKKKYPYYVVYDAAFNCFANNPRVVESVLGGGEETPISVVTHDPNIMKGVNGVDRLTPQCLYADNLGDGEGGLYDGLNPRYDPVLPNGLLLRDITEEQMAKFLALPDFKPPVPVPAPKQR